MDLLDELYDGNIRPNEKLLKESSEYEKLLNILTDKYAELYKLLNGKEQCILKKIEETESEITSLTDREAFKQGFALGMKLALETITYKSESFKPVV